MNKVKLLFIYFLCIGCQQATTKESNQKKPVSNKEVPKVALMLLGTVQDAGSPQIGCKKECCSAVFNQPDNSRKITSLGIIDSENNKKYLFEASPDMSLQAHWLKEARPDDGKETPDGIFLTHAHIGHYTGLMYLGKEAMNANKVPVFAMPRMKEFLEKNGPWGQLLSNQNIEIQPLKADSVVNLTTNLQVIPFQVPHRDEYSETVGYTIIGPNKRVLFIPDIDKWQKWDRNIVEEVGKVDYAFLDATFYDGAEINNRDISEIPHPFVVESMALFKSLPESERQKIFFIHFNHTNPLLNLESIESAEVFKNGYNIAVSKTIFEL